MRPAAGTRAAALFAAAVLCWISAGPVSRASSLDLLAALPTANPYRQLDPLLLLALVACALCLYAACRVLDRTATDARTTGESRGGTNAFALYAAAGLALPGLLVAAPSLFLWLTAEDRPVEFVQFMAFALSALAWSVALVRTIRKDLTSSLLAGGAMLVFLSLAGEEISWGQRVIGFDTPAILAANLQGEANLHNLRSGLFNKLVLWFALVMFGIAPFLRGFLGERHERLRALCPDRYAFLVYACGVGFHPGYGNRLGLLLIVLALVACAHHALVLPAERRLAWQLGFATIAAAATASFVFDGRLGEFWWRIDECRELFIALALLVYSVSAARRFHAVSVGDGPRRDTSGGTAAAPGGVSARDTSD